MPPKKTRSTSSKAQSSSKKQQQQETSPVTTRSKSTTTKTELNIPFGLLHTFGLFLFNYSCLIMVSFLMNLDLIKLTGFEYICGGLKCPTVDFTATTSSSAINTTTSAKPSKCPVTFLFSCTPLHINIGLLLSFALQHSGMAREVYKKIATTIGYHDRIERSVYIVASSLALLLLCFGWDASVRFPSSSSSSDFVFSWTSIRTISMFSMQFVGVLLLLYSMITFKGLLGSEKAWYGIDAEKESGGVIVTESAHGWIRHPMMVGLMFSIIPSPFYEYTLSRAVFVGGLCLYVVVAVIFFEEPDLKKNVKGYKKYAETVKYRFVPGIL